LLRLSAQPTSEAILMSNQKDQPLARPSKRLRHGCPYQAPRQSRASGAIWDIGNRKEKATTRGSTRANPGCVDVSIYK
jgi:hypothetical protein